MSREEENEKLKKKIQELEQALEKERVEKETIQKEFEEFKAKHAHTVSELQKALKIKADKQKNGKPLGLPNGHKGYARHVPERIDRIKALIPKSCPECNVKLEGDTLLTLTSFLRLKTHTMIFTENTAEIVKD